MVELYKGARAGLFGDLNEMKCAEVLYKCDGYYYSAKSGSMILSKVSTYAFFFLISNVCIVIFFKQKCFINQNALISDQTK